MSDCGCGPSLAAGIREGWKFGMTIGAATGGATGAAVGASLTAGTGPGVLVGKYFGGVYGAFIGAAGTGALSAIYAYGAHAIFGECGCSPICFCLPSNPKNKDWKDPQSTIPRPVPVDPLILDLNRDGSIELQNAAFFDLNANGFHEYTSWISETDAFLVLDKNFNDIIDNGSELFGDAMILPDGSRALTGFDALRAYDSNSDGKIDSNDEIYSSLKVLTGAGEMASLTDAGISSISLTSSDNVYDDTIPEPPANFTFEERSQYFKDQIRARERYRF
ncbi:hypothetical protein FACS1894204_01620 [Synergistales bacterium]|nr:hypothetical protein FACS1894204_01620 [Synergistales bacterium]